MPLQNGLRVGDVVLVKIPFKPRHFWALGIFSGEDSVLTFGEVKQRGIAVQDLSLKHMFPLELSLSYHLVGAMP